MANPFNRPTPAATTGVAALPQFKTSFLRHRWGVRDAQHAVMDSHSALVVAESGIPASGAIPDAAKEAFDAAARNLNNDVSRLEYAHGKLGASIKGMFKSMADTVGIDTSKWASSKIKGDATQALERATKVKGNLIERTLSKPFRILANNPKTALVVGGALAVVGIGGAVKHSAEKRTQENAEAQVNEAQQQAAMMRAGVNPYQISSADAALLDAQMRGGQGPQSGHADALLAARQQQAAPGQAVA